MSKINNRTLVMFRNTCCIKRMDFDIILKKVNEEVQIAENTGRTEITRTIYYNWWNKAICGEKKMYLYLKKRNGEWIDYDIYRLLQLADRMEASDERISIIMSGISSGYNR